MRTFVRRLVPVVMMSLASMAAVTIATPAVSSAQCANGEWWDPTAKCVPAARRRGATARMRQRLVVGSDRQRLPSATITAGRLANSGGSYLTRALQRYRARAAGRFSRAQTPRG